MEGVGHNRFVVGVRCMTYNQSSYIIDALNGFVMQQTSFPFVCMIVDDASTDCEPEVILNYLRDYFDLQDESVAYDKEMDYGRVLFSRHLTNRNCFFAVVLLKENHNSQRKSKEPYIAEWLNTRFVALCEGDDYWIDPLKLQRQVDYMDAHPKCALTVHAALWEKEGHRYTNGCEEALPRDYSVEELIRCGGFYFATASFVYRAELDKDMPEWRQKSRVGDFPLQILSGLRGDVHYLPDLMCVYRYLREGSWSFNQLNIHAVDVAFQKNKIEWMTALDDATGHKYRGAIFDLLFQHFNALFNAHEIGFWPYAKAVSKMDDKRYGYGRLIKDSIRIYLTPLYRFLSRFRSQ